MMSNFFKSFGGEETKFIQFRSSKVFYNKGDNTIEQLVYKTYLVTDSDVAKKTIIWATYGWICNVKTLH
jgi:hypothetical protein